MTSCFIILNKTNSKLTLREFLTDFPGVVENMQKEVIDKINLYPGENYIDLIPNHSSKKESSKFQWKEEFISKEF